MKFLGDASHTNQTGNTYIYEWGAFGNPYYSRHLGGTPRHDIFEDVLAASSSGCLGIYVPIHQLTTWEVVFDGGLDLFGLTWIGGSSSALSSILTKPETIRGPANARAQNGALQF